MFLEIEGRHPGRMEQATSHHQAPDAAGIGAASFEPDTRAPFPEDRLHRSRRDRMLAGVAAGLADYFAIDPILVRIAFVGLALAGGLAVPLYLAGWLLIPDEDGGPTVAEEILARERAL